MATARLIRTARKRAGLTQSGLALRAHTSAPTISAYEHGVRRPRADVVLRLSAAAGLEPALVPASTDQGRYVDLVCDELADRIRRAPAVMEQAHGVLDDMRDSDNVRAWRSMVAAGPTVTIAVLTSRDPDVRGLKADNPFARLGLVDEATRPTASKRSPGWGPRTTSTSASTPTGSHSRRSRLVTGGRAVSERNSEGPRTVMLRAMA